MAEIREYKNMWAKSNSRMLYNINGSYLQACIFLEAAEFR